MSTIQTKRKKSTGNANVTLVAAEPYYNLADKSLYLGDADGTNTFEGKKHIAELSVSSDTARQLKLAIGEAKDNEVTLKVAHTDATHNEGVYVSDKAITLYVDSYIKTDVDNKIMTSTELHLTKLDDNKSSLQVGSNESNSFKIALNHSTPESPDLEGVFWNDDDNILYITVSAYTKSEIDTKVTNLSNDITYVSNNLRDNYYAKTDTYSRTETNSLVGDSTNMSISSSVQDGELIAQVKVGSGPNYYKLYVRDSEIEIDGKLLHGWTVNDDRMFLNLKPYYTKDEVDGKIAEGITSKMSVENGVLKFSNG